ncbi:hypothetical protein BJX65DRAFT_187956 [Aspergillus insuetus]
MRPGKVFRLHRRPTFAQVVMHSLSAPFRKVLMRMIFSSRPSIPMAESCQRENKMWKGDKVAVLGEGIGETGQRGRSRLCYSPCTGQISEKKRAERTIPPGRSIRHQTRSASGWEGEWRRCDREVARREERRFKELLRVRR